MKKYLQNDVKIKYAEEELKKVFSASNKSYPSGKYRRPYNIDFSVNGKYNEKSFDHFLRFHMKRIYDIFLSNAASMAQDGLGWFSEPVLGTHQTFESFLDNFKNGPRLMY